MWNGDNIQNNKYNGTENKQQQPIQRTLCFLFLKKIIHQLQPEGGCFTIKILPSIHSDYRTGGPSTRVARTWPLAKLGVIVLFD